MDLSLFFAGTGGSVPTARRGLPALLLRAGGDRLLFDCGEGTQRQLLRSIGLPELDAVFLTHYHADHWLGLPGMLKTFDLRGREAPLTVYGPPGLRAIFDAMRPAYGRVSYPLRLEELGRHDEVGFGGYAVSSFPVEHRIPAYGYAFVEDDRPGRFDPRRPPGSV
jgi:ribonuclease Z